MTPPSLPWRNGLIAHREHNESVHEIFHLMIVLEGTGLSEAFQRELPEDQTLGLSAADDQTAMQM